MEEYRDIYEGVDSLYASIQELHRDEAFPDTPDPQHSHLVPTLKPYQCKAVRWMLSRESAALSFDDLLPSTSIQVPTGGILADEMGLGKTVEVIACVLLNPRNMDENQGSISESPNNSIFSSDDESTSDSLVKAVKKQARAKTVPKRQKKAGVMNDDSFDSFSSVIGDVKTEPQEENPRVNEDEQPVGTCTKSIRSSKRLQKVKNELPSDDFRGIGVDSDISADENLLRREIKAEILDSPMVEDEAKFSRVNDIDPLDIGMEEKPLIGNCADPLDIGMEEKPLIGDCTDPLDISTETDEKPLSQRLLEAQILYPPTKGKAKSNPKGRKRKVRVVDESTHEVPEKRANLKAESLTDQSKGADTISTRLRNGKAVKVADAPSKKPGKAKVSSTKQQLNEWYEAMLNEVRPKSRKPVEETSNLHCFCENPRETGMIQCADCLFYQHKVCVGYNSKKMRQKDYLCPSCIVKKNPLPAKTTFIVSPSSISEQWIEEIEKHTNPRLKVLKYDGVRINGYIQPSTIAEYDVLLTTYESLAKELNYVPDEIDGASRSLRHAKRYFSPQSPLTCLEWWRVCLDEAQMVESHTAKPSVMTRRLPAIHRWAVTGTPIQKTVDDLMGLMEFLGLNQLAVPRNWRELREKSDEFIYFLSRIMWRHSKHEVVHEFGVPPQTVNCVWLKFSAIESHFYKRQHEECAGQFLAKVSKYSSLNIPLRSIDRKEVSRILLPLLSLRQACSHPQAVRGKLLCRRETMTMSELLDTMVKKTQIESEEFLRQYISALNGMAGLNVLIEDIGAAINHYREVLQLCQNYEGSLTADTLQKIHTLHNLADLMEFKPENIAPTLRDTSAKEDAAKLEKEYLDKRKVVMANTQQQAAVFAADVGKLCVDGATLGFSDWWVNVIHWAPSSKELIKNLKSALPDPDRLPDGFTSIGPKISSKDRLLANLATWLGDMDSLRVSVINGLNLLEVTATEDLVHKALCCHLRQSRAAKKSCPLCEIEEQLRAYETHLFMVTSGAGSSKATTTVEGDEGDEEEETQEVKPSSSKTNSLEALKKGKVYEVSWKGSWKNSQYLIVLTALANFARSSGAKGEWQDDAKQHLKLMDVLKREFRTLRALWTQNSELVQSCDELVMAKMRFRLRLPSDTPKKKVANKMDHLHIIEPHMIDFELHRLKLESVKTAENLKRKTGTLLYLRNLQKEKSEEKVNDCPICRVEMKERWAVLVCGHCICYECIPSMLSVSASKEHVECAICRDKCVVAEISYVDCQGVPNDDQVKGSYSTKVEGVIRLVQKLTAEDSSVKILVFSSWEKVLGILEEGFKQNSIGFQRLMSGKTSKYSIKNFKTKKEMNVLLLPYKSGSKGLNLTEATHVILVEPVLNPSDELQAVGRVHRMGQTKPTFVHRLVIENSIEEKMLTAIKDSEVNQWRKNQVTLNQLSELFSSNYASSKIESTGQPTS